MGPIPNGFSGSGACGQISWAVMSSGAASSSGVRNNTFTGKVYSMVGLSSAFVPVLVMLNRVLGRVSSKSRSKQWAMFS